MIEPTDERAEHAFRRAFADRAGEAEARELQVPHGRSRRTGLIAGLAAAAAVVAVVVPVVLLAGDGGKEPSDGLATEPAAGMRWAGYRGIEVQVPQDWGYGYSPERPDCIEPDRPGEWDGDVPGIPYVEIEQKGRPVRAIGCTPDPAVRGPEEFGQLPVALWQPYVRFSDPDEFGAADGEWEHAGWRLTARTVDDVRISVLSGPKGEADLADRVFASVRQVDVDANGCATTSPVQAAQFSRPDAVVPAADEVDAVAVCKYERTGTDAPGLIGARRIEGREAQDLVQAIHAAPAAAGPDSPGDCLPDDYGREALSLRFLGAEDRLLGVAYVYYESCFGNGIFDAKAEHALTAGNCKPLFAAPPVTLWSGFQRVFEACASPN